MKIMKAVALEKYADAARYEKISNVVFKNLSNGNYNLALSCELEEGEDSQYPLEDILDTYYVNCTDYFEIKTDGEKTLLLFELEGSLSAGENLKNITAVSELIGKHVYNKEEDGKIKLIIE